MSRVADTLFIGFAISPDHSPEHPLEPDSVDIKVITTCQFRQYPEYARIVQELEDTVREQLGTRHVFGFRQRLNQIRDLPGGHVVVNRRARIPDVHLALGFSIPRSPQHFSGMY